MTTANGFKHVGLLMKKATQRCEEIVAHWQAVHGKIALGLPGLRGYVLNPGSV